MNEAEAFRVLALLVAVSESAMAKLDALEPPGDAETRDAVERSRDLVYAFMTYDGRFAKDRS